MSEYDGTGHSTLSSTARARHGQTGLHELNAEPHLAEYRARLPRLLTGPSLGQNAEQRNDYPVETRASWPLQLRDCPVSDLINHSVNQSVAPLYSASVIPAGMMVLVALLVCSGFGDDVEIDCIPSYRTMRATISTPRLLPVTGEYLVVQHRRGLP